MANHGSFWSKAIKPKILSPITIVKLQANALTEQTGGVLVGELSRNQLDNGLTLISLNIFVPSIDFRQGILQIAHNSELPYPCMVEADIFPQTYFNIYLRNGTIPRILGNQLPNIAASDEDLSEIIKKVLQSDSVVSTAQSLIARANDALEENEARTEIAVTENPAEEALLDIVEKFEMENNIDGEFEAEVQKENPE